MILRKDDHRRATFLPQTRLFALPACPKQGSLRYLVRKQGCLRYLLAPNKAVCATSLPQTGIFALPCAANRDVWATLCPKQGCWGYFLLSYD
ncbi:MAG: hypothetical protein ACPGWR_15390 [Ardenticatenaceae bacterium]